ncbi:hypothetical protein BJ138DRAFT_1141540 [Hygrophoropsis aurantiaca]|uniref:Uncharacterized protein n=1 Tax=Hygrophoropsis aurantiaca TaxID=72124 RepID=A0ACB8AQW4_9AGAM|nr:hypothetical protein BJ138DRAFT_1141540 [Hygrophoropsis aurantiaca]
MSAQCSAIASAMSAKGISYAQLSQRIGVPEPRVIEICTGKSAPTSSEFGSICQVLGITNPPPGHTFR